MDRIFKTKKIEKLLQKISVVIVGYSVVLYDDDDDDGDDNNDTRFFPVEWWQWCYKKILMKVLG